MNILINGLGNIGTTLIELLLKYKGLLALDTVYAVKNLPKTWEKHRYEKLQSEGVVILSPAQINDIQNKIDFVFDTTANGIASRNKEIYEFFPNLIGAVAQGSETEFGFPYMAGINDKLLLENKYITVVSCNTHGIVSVMQYISGNNLDNIYSADFVIVRRCEDIGNRERLVSGTVVARNRSVYGTHHATDAASLLETVGKKIKLCSSDITTPSQFLHSLRFNINLKENVTNDTTIPLVAETEYFDSNRVFEIGRRDGFQGRLYSHSIVVTNNILHQENNIIGWAFIPQEGNTLLSTLKAFLIKTTPDTYEEKFDRIADELILHII